MDDPVTVKRIPTPGDNDFPSVDGIGLQQTPEQKVAFRIGKGLNLSEDEKICALLEAMGLSPVQVAAQMEFPFDWVATVRRKGDYKLMLSRCIALKASNIVRMGKDIDEVFNNEVRNSARTLIEVRDNPFSSGKERVAAAKEFLDRAPDAPKSRKVEERHQTVIHLPVSELKNMQDALLESGTEEDMEVYNLIEGRDYHESD